MFEAAAISLTPVSGAVHTGLEYQAKVMSDVPPYRAEGRDFSEYLPGLFWLNYFGGPYVELIGLERLTGAPVETRVVGGAVVVELPGGPSAWDSDEYRSAEDAALRHIGEEFFFSKDLPGYLGFAGNRNYA
jgi:hypothetical protein